jgi:hypothetical protein
MKMQSSIVRGTEEYTLSSSICSSDMMAAHAPPATGLSSEPATQNCGSNPGLPTRLGVVHPKSMAYALRKLMPKHRRPTASIICSARLHFALGFTRRMGGLCGAVILSQNSNIIIPSIQAFQRELAVRVGLNRNKFRFSFQDRYFRIGNTLAQPVHHDSAIVPNWLAEQCRTSRCAGSSGWR